ncbi:hypothetical protein TcasGA2_TC011890 [Tribolium castaneum]|uniref:Uncharacterized protein n=1 Tax=Tribolium castaneum TaxID=7070 RepID=D6WZ70_TRICA|nr:hypothetical protein TcasGA2_TC011890 [Tribolium castaneum]
MTRFRKIPEVTKYLEVTVLSNTPFIIVHLLLVNISRRLIKENAHLYSEQAHCYQSDPAVQGVEVGDGRLGEIVGIQNRQETDGDAGNRQSVKHGVEELDVDSPATPTYSVQEDGCKIEDVSLVLRKMVVDLSCRCLKARSISYRNISGQVQVRDENTALEGDNIDSYKHINDHSN